MKSKNLNQLVSNEVTQKLIFIFFMKIFFKSNHWIQQYYFKKYKYSINECHHFNKNETIV